MIAIEADLALRYSDFGGADTRDCIVHRLVNRTRVRRVEKKLSNLHALALSLRRSNVRNVVVQRMAAPAAEGSHEPLNLVRYLTPLRLLSDDALAGRGSLRLAPRHDDLRSLQLGIRLQLPPNAAQRRDKFIVLDRWHSARLIPSYGKCLQCCRVRNGGFQVEGRQG